VATVGGQLGGGFRVLRIKIEVRGRLSGKLRLRGPTRRW
jgi:hypothetical protein